MVLSNYDCVAPKSANMTRHIMQHSKFSAQACLEVYISDAHFQPCLWCKPPPPCKHVQTVHPKTTILGQILDN